MGAAKRIPEIDPVSVSDGSTPAGIGIDETLRLARVELEEEIARFRVIFLGATTLLTGIAITTGRLLGGEAPVVVPFYFAGALLGALLLYRLQRRSGPTAPVVYSSIVFDVIVPALVHPMLTLIEEDETFEGLLFTPWLSGASIVLVIVLHSLRSDRRALAFTSALGALAAVTLVLTSMTAAMDEGGRAYVTRGYLALPLEALIPLSMMVIGMIGIASALGFYADGHARRRLRIHARVLRYVPEAAYEHVRSETTDASIRAPGKLVEVTILASDLRGFTTMSEKLPPQAVVEQLNAYHDAMCREIERHGGMLDKLIGDGALAVFGWKGPSDDAGANDAIACARAMRATLEELNRVRATRSLPPLAMGIGVHTGWCVAGNVGAGKKLSFTYIGDAVNAASRIEGLTKELGAPVLASEETVSRLSSPGGTRPLGAVTVRGKTEAMRLHAVD